MKPVQGLGRRSDGLTGLKIKFLWGYHERSMLAQRCPLLMTHELKVCANTLASSTYVIDGENVNGRPSFDNREIPRGFPTLHPYQ